MTLHLTSDEPIIKSLLQVDWYKFPMGNFVHERHRNTRVRYAFINRHASSVCLPNFISKSELVAELDHARSLCFMNREVEYLRGSQYIPRGLFSNDYADALGELALPELDITWTPTNYSIEVEGTWHEAMPWETIVMNVVNQLYFRKLMKEQGISLERVWAEGARRLFKKIALLKTRPHMKIVDFGLRRSFQLAWSDWIDSVLVEELGDQLAGISDVYLAKKYDKKPSGTCAHEMLMVYAALCGDNNAELRSAPMRFTKKWNERYGHYATMAIPDTFGSDSFRADLTHSLATMVENYKIDSGDTNVQGDRWIDTFKRLDVDPLTRSLVFSDGLTIEKCFALDDYFRGRVGLAPFGIGTHLTNDVGFTPISIVMKASAVQCDGAWIPTVKLSDNLEKACGPNEKIERYIRVFDYHNAFRERCAV